MKCRLLVSSFIALFAILGLAYGAKKGMISLPSRKKR